MARRKASSGTKRYIPGVTERSDPQPLPPSTPPPLPMKQRIIDAQLQGERAGRGAAQSAFSLAPEGMDEKAFETVLDVGDAIDAACQVAQRIAKRQIEKKMPAFETEAERKAWRTGAEWSVERCLQGICDSDRTAPCADDEGPLFGLGCGCGRRR